MQKITSGAKNAVIDMRAPPGASRIHKECQKCKLFRKIRQKCKLFRKNRQRCKLFRKFLSEV